MRAIILAGLFATAIAAGACGDDGEPVDPEKEAAAIGMYVLTSVDGTAIPFQYGQSDTSRFFFDTGSVALEANHDLTDELTTTEKRISNGALIGAEAIQRLRGTWSISGDSVRLHYPGLGDQKASVSGSLLTYKAGGFTFQYTK